MANQRMFLRCRSCGGEKMIAKRLISAFHVLPSVTPTDWDQWFYSHEWGFCGTDPGGTTSGHGLDIFELVYEHHVPGKPWQSDGGA